MKTKVYNKEGKEVKEIDLNEAIFGQELNNALVHQVIVSMMSNQRFNTAHTKDRSEVRGGGKKPWKQKGTGRARHGSRRSPIWVGGGITFGPRVERNFDKKINRKMKRAALFQILSQKLKDGEIIFVEELAFEEPKTKLAKEFLENISKVEKYQDILKKRRGALILNPELNKNNIKAFKNIKNVETDEMRKINPLDVLKYKYLVIINPEEAVKILEEKLNK